MPRCGQVHEHLPELERSPPGSAPSSARRAGAPTGPWPGPDRARRGGPGRWGAGRVGSSATWDSPTWARMMSASARELAPVGRRRRVSAAICTFSRAVRVPKSSSRWKVRAIPSRARWCGETRVMSAPPSRTRPWVGGCSPVMTLNSVVLPAPLGPMSPFTAPGVDLEVDVLERLEPAEADRDLLDGELRQPNAPPLRSALQDGGPGHRSGVQLVDDRSPARPLRRLPEVGDLGVEPADAVGVAADGHDTDADEQLGEVGDLRDVRRR